MPIPTEVGAAFRVRLPVVLVRAAANTSTLQPDLGGDGVVASTATYTLYSPTGASLATPTPSISGTTGLVSVTISAGDLPTTLAFGERYREVWSLTIGGKTQLVTRSAVLARYPLHCPVTQRDLDAEYPDLASMLRATSDDLQAFIDSAWEEAVRRLLAGGKWPEQIVDAESLIDPVKHLALAKVWRFYSVQGGQGGRAAELATEHAREAEVTFARVSFRVDADQDGVADGDDRAAGLTVLTRSPAPSYNYRRSYSRGGRRLP